MAGRIPQPFIDDLIDRSDIVEVVSSRVQLKKSGEKLLCLLPLPRRKSPSFTVSPQKQFYYCFGCGAGGNVIGFLMEHDHLDFPLAVEQLAKAAGMEVPREESSPRAEAQQRRRQDIYSALEGASRFYQMQLRKHAPAIDYLKARGLTGQIAKEFALGYAPDEWDSLIKLNADSSETLRLLAEGGMLIKRDQNNERQDSVQNRTSTNDRSHSSTNDRSHYDRFRDRIMFPIRDQRGRTIAFGGRVLGDQKPKYLNSPETPVFHKSRELYGLYESLQQRKRPDELIVVEGYMDVVALAQFGVRNAVATLGTSVGTAHMDRIFRHVSQVVFCFDGDAAGRSAAQRALDACLPAMLDGRQARFLFLPEGEDPDSIIRSEGTDGFQRRIASAKSLSDFIFELAGEGLDLSNADHKALFAHNCLTYLQQIPKGLLQSVLIQRLADETGLEKQQLLEGIKTESPKPATPRVTSGEEGPSLQEVNSPEPESSSPERPLSENFKKLLALILQAPKLALREDLDDELLKREDSQGLDESIRTLVRQNPTAEFINLHGYWTGYAPEIAEQLTQIYGSSLLKALPEEKLEADFSETLTRFKHRLTRAEIEQRIREIASVPFEKLTPELREEQRNLHNKLSGRQSHNKS